MNTGWIKIYRSLLYWEWADVPEMVALWVRLIIRFYFEADREIWMPKFKEIKK